MPSARLPRLPRLSRRPARRLPTLPLLALAGAVLLPLAGCANPSTGSSQPAGGGTAKTGTKGWGLSPVPAVTKLVPDDIRQKGVVNNAIYNDAPPQMFLEKNVLVGIQPDLAQAVSEVMGVKFNNISVGSFDSIIPGLQGKRYDVAFADFGVTRERMKIVDFVEQFSLGTGFALKEGAGKKITTANDLCGLKLGVLAGSYFAEQVKELDGKCKAAGKAAITLQIYPTASAAILAVTNGRTDAFSSSEDQLGYAAKQGGARLQAQSFIYKPVIQAIGVQKGSPLAKPIQAAMAELVAGGTYKKILDKWGIPGAAITSPQKVRINPTPQS